MKRLILFIFVLILQACTSSGRSDQERAVLLLRLGSSHLANGQYPIALRELLEAETLDSQNPVIQNNLGLAYYYRERLDLARTHIENAISLRADYTEAKVNLARILIDLKKAPAALELVEDALKDLTFDKPAKVYLTQGLAYFSMQNYVLASRAFKKTLEFGIDNCQAQNYLGRSFFESKDFKAATEILDRAVGFCKNLQVDEPHYYSALAYYQIGEKTKAEARLEEVLKLYPQGKYQDRAKAMLETIRK